MRESYWIIWSFWSEAFVIFRRITFVMVLGWFPGLFPRLRMEVNLQSLVFRVEGQQMQALDERAAQVHRSTLWGLPKADAPFLALNLNHPTIVGMFHEYQPSNLGIPHFKKKNRFTIIDPPFFKPCKLCWRCCLYWALWVARTQTFCTSLEHLP